MAKRAADLGTVFYQENYSEEYCWYHDVVKAEEDDMKVVLRCIFHFILSIIQDDEDNNNSKQVDVDNQKEREAATRMTSVVQKEGCTKLLPQFPSVDICYKKK